MTRFPIIKEAVAQYFGEDPIDHINPDEVVACGASDSGRSADAGQRCPLSGPARCDVSDARCADRRGHDGRNHSSQHRHPDLGVEDLSHTVRDNQTEVRIKVYQGDARDVGSNYHLGEFILDGLVEGRVVRPRSRSPSTSTPTGWWRSWPRHLGRDPPSRCGSSRPQI